MTKCIRFGKNVHFVKDNLLPVPPVFREIQKVSRTDDAEMHRVYNMGQRLEITVRGGSQRVRHNLATKINTTKSYRQAMVYSGSKPKLLSKSPEDLISNASSWKSALPP